MGTGGILTERAGTKSKERAQRVIPEKLVKQIKAADETGEGTRSHRIEFAGSGGEMTHVGAASEGHDGGHGSHAEHEQIPAAAPDEEQRHTGGHDHDSSAGTRAQ